MTQKQQIQLFEEKRVRTVWDDEKEEWASLERNHRSDADPVRKISV